VKVVGKQAQSEWAIVDDVRPVVGLVTEVSTAKWIDCVLGQ